MIHFYDLGVYNGLEIDMFIQIAGELNQDYRIYGFEAYPAYVKKLKDKFSSNDKIAIYPLMISDQQGLQPLYISTAAEGHSKYATKNNATKDFVMVPAMKFSDFVNKDEFKNQFNIVRFNIEGAEWDFINDMIYSGLHQFVNIWLGAKEGEDILKCAEIKHLYPVYIDLLRKNKINIHRFIYWGKNQNVDLKQLILKNL